MHTGIELLFTGPLLAGMPIMVINEVPKLRLEAISFFLLAFALCAWGVQALWNLLQKDFPSLPRLTYLKAAGLTLIVGLLFMTVLTMISGARELMTPGAWEKRGATYRLKDERSPQHALAEAQLRALAHELEKYASAHYSAFPAHEFVEEIPKSAWLAGQEGVRFIYVAGQILDSENPRLLAYPPGNPKDERPVLLTNLEIVTLHPTEIDRRLKVMVAQNDGE